MKLSVTFLLLAVGSICLLQSVTAKPYNLLISFNLNGEDVAENGIIDPEDDYIKPEPYEIEEFVKPEPRFEEPEDEFVKPMPVDEPEDEFVKPEPRLEKPKFKFQRPMPVDDEEFVKPEPRFDEPEDEFVKPVPVEDEEFVKPMPVDETEEEFIKPEPRLEKPKFKFQRPMPVDDEEYVKPKPIDEEDEFQKPMPVEEEPEEEFVKPEPRAAECRIAVRGGLADPQPVFLKTDSAEFYPYSNTGVMEVDAGKTMQLWCPSEFKSIASKLITATCVSGSTFRVGGTTYDFKELKCKSWPGFVAQKTGATCNGGIMIRVGFEIASNRFAKQMDICFNENEEVTRYVYHTLNPGSNYYETGVDRITFQTAGYFGGKNVDKLYTQNTQMETINKELGGDGDKYFQTNKNIFLARGHMGAKADFVYADQQRATFLFINAAPQWQVFNAGNWQRVEDGLRSWVSKEKKNVECYTGVWGVTTLPNNKGVQTPLYLSYDNNHNGQIPVPKLYFRVVIEPSTKKGIVLIGVNNPHLTLEEIKKDYIICPDVSNKVTYINWKKTDITAGYSYACEVAEFRKKVTHLPTLSATGGLLL